VESTLLIAMLGLAAWIGLIALQLADLVLTASRVPQLSAFVAIRDELEELAGARLSAGQLQGYRERIAVLDAREAARAVPAGRGANAQLWRGTPWRLIPVVLSLLPFLLFASRLPVGLLALVLPVVGYVLALAAARASVAAAGARGVIHAHQRAEIADLLEGAAKSSRPPVAGLGDRVRRALKILREQQG
jgi:hypothetical protein